MALAMASSLSAKSSSYKVNHNGAIFSVCNLFCCTGHFSRYFLWLFELNSCTLSCLYTAQGSVMHKTNKLNRLYVFINIFLLFRFCYLLCAFAMHLFGTAERKTEPKDYRSQAKWNKSCNNINNNDDDVMLYICRLFAYNVNIKYGWISGGFCVVAISIITNTNKAFIALICICRFVRGHTRSKWWEWRTKKNLPTKMNIEQQANAENEQNQGNSKRFNATT